MSPTADISSNADCKSSFECAEEIQNLARDNKIGVTGNPTITLAIYFCFSSKVVILPLALTALD
jgi:hypothetical protein